MPLGPGRLVPRASATAARRGRWSSIPATPTPSPASAGVDAVEHGRRGRGARRSGASPSEIFMASTGVIGEPLDGDAHRPRARRRSPPRRRPDGLMDAAKAIMTTDTYPEGRHRARRDRRRRASTINGIAKGAGMIAPDMATMLSYVFTDAPIAAAGAAGDAVEIGRALVQRDHRRQRHLDLRHADAVRHRRRRRRRAADRGRRRSARSPPSGARSTSSCSISPIRSCATARARANSSRSRSKGAASPQGRQAHRAVDRQFAAGQDRDRRRGRQLGPRRHGGRQGRREGRARQARHLVRQDPRRPRGPARSRLRRGGGLGLHEERTRSTSPPSSASARGRATVWTCDLTKEYVAINGDYRS